jgi:hypothetical protein
MSAARAAESATRTARSAAWSAAHAAWAVWSGVESAGYEWQFEQLLKIEEGLK